MKRPRIFISYSHDSESHKAWVSKLATDLMERGIDVLLDQWNLGLGEDIAAFMERGVSETDRVLLICSELYVAKANAGQGGVGYERLIVSGEIVSRIDTKKFIPIVRGASPAAPMPTFLGPRRYLDLTADADYDARLDELAREIHGIPASTKPKLGVNPYAATLPAEPSAIRTTGPSGVLSSGKPVLADTWFDERASDAAKGIAALNLAGSMEIRLALHEGVRKSQLELLAAVRNSQVHTFGWPIGVTLETREEFKPRPFNDGIRAEVAIAEAAQIGGPSYDFWAARSNGDFYTMQSFFEDKRAERKLFFNTRIVRITEGLLFASNLCQELGASQDARVSVSFAHNGLTGRTLSSSTPNRQVWPRTCVEQRSEGQVTDTIAGLRSNIVAHVMKVAEPIFMLFEFAQFKDDVYSDIVMSYVNGRTT